MGIPRLRIAKVLRLWTAVLGISLCLLAVPDSGIASSFELGFEAGGALSAPAFNTALVASYGEASVRYFGKLEWNPWLMPQSSTDRFRAGALNIGLGAEYRFLNDRVRTGMALGVSRLMFQTALDEKGSKGVFLELIPLGIRWPLEGDWTIRFDPVSISVVAPVLSGIPLILLQYRHTAAVEWSF